MEADSQARRWTLVAVCTTTFMLLLDITIVNVALPSIQRDLNASLTGLQWVVDAYALTLAALILTAGALADRFGRRLLFMVGVIVFTGSSLVCGLAWNIAALDVARAVQGVGGAALFATALALIGHEYRGPERGGAIALWGATIGAAVASGPLVGGILTDALSWRWVFFVNVPVGAFALFVALTKMRESRDEGAVRADLAGLFTLSASLFLIVFGLLRGNSSGWTSALILSCLIGGAALLVVFVLVELMQERPMLDISLFRQPAFLGVSIATFCIGAGMFALFPYLSIYLQDVLGYSPLGAGVRFLPLTVFVFAVPLAMRRFAPAAPFYLVIAIGLALTAGSLLLMHGLTANSHWTALLAGLIVGGLGIGLANPAIAASALRVVDPARTGMASGVNNAFRLSGVAVGVAALGAVLERRAASSLGSSLGPHGRALGQAVASTGTRAGGGKPAVVHAASLAFVSGLNAVLIVGCVTVAVGALAAATLMRTRAPVAAPAREHS
ncbi:MAG TPA: MFS transporter [Gaiellaceae bacterium]|jgi:EmrB/QacA subfamily drug resistance transporter